MRTKIIQIRLTARQHELAILKKEFLGYGTLSQLIRDLLFKNDLSTFKMIQDIHLKIIGEDKNGKNKTCLQRR
jgi:hypothetical protein